MRYAVPIRSILASVMMAALAVSLLAAAGRLDADEHTTGVFAGNKTIAVPSYVADIAKVQIWCSWAEVLLGEASFPSPVK